MGYTHFFRCIDFGRVAAALGSGDQRFCKQVQRRVDETAEERGLDDDQVTEWKRAIAALVTGELGHVMARRGALSNVSPVKLGEALAWGFQLTLLELSQGPKGDAELQHSGSSFYDVFLGRYVKKLLGHDKLLAEHMVNRPLFGVVSGILPPSWGALAAAEIAVLDRALPTVEDAPDAKDGDVEQWYFDLREIVTAIRKPGVDMVTFYE